NPSISVWSPSGGEGAGAVGRSLDVGVSLLSTTEVVGWATWSAGVHAVPRTPTVTATAHDASRRDGGRRGLGPQDMLSGSSYPDGCSPDVGPAPERPPDATRR